MAVGVVFSLLITTDHRSYIPYLKFSSHCRSIPRDNSTTLQIPDHLLSPFVSPSLPIYTFFLWSRVPSVPFCRLSNPPSVISLFHPTPFPLNVLFPRSSFFRTVSLNKTTSVPIQVFPSAAQSFLHFLLFKCTLSSFPLLALFAFLAPGETFCPTKLFPQFNVSEKTNTPFSVSLNVFFVFYFFSLNTFLHYTRSIQWLNIFDFVFPQHAPICRSYPTLFSILSIIHSDETALFHPAPPKHPWVASL